MFGFLHVLIRWIGTKLCHFYNCKGNVRVCAQHYVQQ